MDASWWKRAVIYRIHPRSFADASGDGIGDLAGMRQHLDHLTWLGVDGLLISPIHPSPMADSGYDVANYTDVDPVFGTLEEFDHLVSAAHNRGLKVLLDWVPNHTSDRHPWFMASRGSRSNPYRDWYWWRDQSPHDRMQASGNGPSWALDPRTDQYYLHHFLPQQPDLNWNNPDVRDAMHDTVRFWLDRGVDGFGANAVHLIGKDPALLDEPSRSPRERDGNRPIIARTNRWLREIRQVLDGYDGERVMIGEIDVPDADAVFAHTGPQALHLALAFDLLRTSWDLAVFRRAIAAVEAASAAAGTWPAWALSNHDVSRHRTRYGRSEDRARAAAVVLLTLRGTPVLYAGEELGLEDAVVPAELAADRGGRDACRAPIPWDGQPHHGWAADTPRLSWPPDAATRNAQAQRREPTSIARLYQRVLRRRHNDEVLQVGGLELIDVHAQVLAYDRVSAAGRRRVLVNFADESVAVDPGDWAVATATRRDRENAQFDGRIGAAEAVVLQPAG